MLQPTCHKEVGPQCCMMLEQETGKWPGRENLLPPESRRVHSAFYLKGSARHVSTAPNPAAARKGHRTEVLFWRDDTTLTLVASGTAKSADLEPAVKIPPGLWRGTGGSIGVLVGGDCGRKSFGDYGPSIYRNVTDSPVFLQDGQIGYKRGRRRGGVIRRRALRWMRLRACHLADCTGYIGRLRLVIPTGEAFRAHVLFNDRAPTPAVRAGCWSVPLTAGVDRDRRPARPKHPTTYCFQMTPLSFLAPPRVNLDGVGPRCECGRIAP